MKNKRAARKRRKKRKQEQLRESIELVREWGRANRAERPGFVAQSFDNIAKQIHDQVNKGMQALGAELVKTGVTINEAGQALVDVFWRHTEPLESVVLTLKHEETRDEDPA